MSKQRKLRAKAVARCLDTRRGARPLGWGEGWASALPGACCRGRGCADGGGLHAGSAVERRGTSETGSDWPEHRGDALLLGGVKRGAGVLLLLGGVPGSKLLGVQEHP